MDGINSAGIGRFAKLDAEKISKSLNSCGFAVVEKVLDNRECAELIAGYHGNGYRKTVNMERHRFGSGEYRYFDNPLPDLIEAARTEIYPVLAPVANEWASKLNIEMSYPATFSEFRDRCRDAGQFKPTPLILKYGPGGSNTLHQDLYGEVYFPMQSAIFLNEPGEDYTGGEFVLTEQVPRSQSKAIVLTPRKGDMIIFTTNFRPVKGSRGFYRANMRHGVSTVHSGERHTLGVIFHDALT